MSDDSLARNPSAAPATAEAAYDAIHATIVATERGRWFLDEHVRRYRGADTALVLAGLDRIEEAIRGSAIAETMPATQNELLALVERIWQARSELIGRQGDPAASGEAAVSDFRRAAEQIQELVLASRDGEPDPGGQLAFQLNRLGGAGDRLERSVAALRVMLGLLDEIEQRLHRLADAPGSHSEATPVPWPEAVPDASVPAWSLPDAEEDSALTAQPAPEPDRPPREAETGYTEALWGLAVPPLGPASGVIAPEDPASEAIVTDWAFDPGDPAPQPIASAAPPAPAPPPSPLSVLERLEAREYGRQRLMTAQTAEPEPEQTFPAGPAAHAKLSSLDDLVIGSAPPERARPVSPLESVPTDWAVAPSEVMAPAESIFDSDLFDTGAQADPSLPEPLARAAPPPPEPTDIAVQTSTAAAGTDDMPSVVDRLESMRSAIAALMDEVSEKTAGRIPPPRP